MEKLTGVLSKFKTYPNEIKVFILSSFVNSMGSAFMWPIVTLYVHNVLGRSFADAGFVLLLQGTAGITGQLVGGGLFHRLGPKKLIVGSLFLAGSLQLSLMFTDWKAYVVVMMLLGFLSSISMPAINALIGFRWKEQRSQLFNVIYVSNNVGMAIGTSLSGLMAVVSFNLTFLFNGLTTIAFASYFMLLLKQSVQEDLSAVSFGRATGKELSLSVASLLTDYKFYMFLSFGSLMLSFSTSQWGSGVAPFLDRQGFSIANYSFLWTVNGIIILVGQPFLHFLKKLMMPSVTHQMVGSAVFYFFGFTYILLLHGSYVHFIVGMFICTFGEMLIAPATPSFITERANAAAPFYLGLVGAFGSAGRLLGPFVFGNMFDASGALPGFILTSLLTFVSVIMFVAHLLANRQSDEGITGKPRIMSLRKRNV